MGRRKGYDHPFEAGDVVVYKEVSPYGAMPPRRARLFREVFESWGVDVPPETMSALREAEESAGVVDHEATRERARKLQEGFWDALAACGMDTPKALAAEIGVSERTARRYISDPTSVTKEAYQRMLKSERLCVYVSYASLGIGMDRARAYVESKSKRKLAFDPEIPAMARRLMRAFLLLQKGQMGTVLEVAESMVGHGQGTGEIMSCNYIRGWILSSGLMDADELPIDTSLFPDHIRL